MNGILCNRASKGLFYFLRGPRHSGGGGTPQISRKPYLQVKPLSVINFANLPITHPNSKFGPQPLYLFTFYTIAHKIISNMDVDDKQGKSLFKNMHGEWECMCKTEKKLISKIFPALLMWPSPNCVVCIMDYIYRIRRNKIRGLYKKNINTAALIKIAKPSPH